MLLGSVVVWDEDQSEKVVSLWIIVDLIGYLVEELHYLLGLSVAYGSLATD
jgi:hypothetical protein